MYYKLSCPVPKEQRPINEYMELAQSSFFNWPILSLTLYRQKIFKTFSIAFIFLLPITNLFLSSKHPFSRLFLTNSVITTIIIILFLTRIFLGWNYIKQRLYDPTIFYEESGWYDGRVWVKSKNILVQDRLIHEYQVIPAIKKLTDMLFVFGSLLVTFLLLFNFY